MSYDKIVMGLITRSITEFSLHDGHNTPRIGQLLPDINVHGKKLYQYQTLDDEERRRYILTYYDIPSRLGPYEYLVEEDVTPVLAIV